MSAVTEYHCSALAAGRVAAPRCARLLDSERFSQMLNERNLDGCGSFEDTPGQGLGSHELKSEERSAGSPARQNMLHFPGHTSHSAAILRNRLDIEEASEQGAPPGSAIVVKFADAIAHRILVGADEVDNSTVQIVLRGELLGDAQVTISFRHDTLRVFIESERLWALLQFQGYAFARDLSARLGMRILVAVSTHSSTPKEQDNNRGSHRIEPVLHYAVGKGT